MILIICGIFILDIIFRLYIGNYLTSFSQNYLIYLAGIFNISLIFLLAGKIFDKKVAYISAFLYAISPWTAYLEVATSNYILILSYLLVLFAGLTFLQNKYFKTMVLAAFISLILSSSQISLFTDLGLINTVNEFRGETSDTSFKLIGKIAENRYIYLSEHVLFNVLKHMSPVTYFTQEFKLLNFSFSPPIFVGFLIPFLLGLSLWVDMWKKYRYTTLVVLTTLIPSVLARFSPDLTKLVIFSPVIFITTSYGLTKILLPAKNKFLKFLLILTILIVTIQAVATILDISTRENLRYQKSVTINK